MNGAVLLTGACGFLGAEILQRLVEDQRRDVIALVRARDEHAAGERLDAAVRRLYEVPPEVYNRVRAVPADLLERDLGLSAVARGEIIDRTEVIVHCAASIRFDLPLDQALRVNADGTDRVLDLADEIERRGSLKQVVQVSTAYVCGRHEGPFLEADLDLGQRFRNPYEQSKLEAERRTRARDLPILIARPSIVVGESTSGWTPSFNVVYWPLQAFARGLIRELPADPNSIVDIVPADYVADAIGCLAQCSGQRGTMHLVAGEGASTVGELVDLASATLGKPAPELTEPPTSKSVDETDVFAPYFDVRAQFDDTRAREYLAPLGHTAPPLSGYFGNLMSYARRTRWGKRPLTREAARLAGAGEMQLRVPAER